MISMHGAMEATAMEATRMETSAVEAAHPTMEASATTTSSDKMQGRGLALWTFRHRRRGACRCGRNCGSNGENSKIVHDDTPFTHPIWARSQTAHGCLMTWGDAAAEYSHQRRASGNCPVAQCD
jgi:hypothetical protein